MMGSTALAGTGYDDFSHCAKRLNYVGRSDEGFVLGKSMHGRKTPNPNKLIQKVFVRILEVLLRNPRWRHVRWLPGA